MAAADTGNPAGRAWTEFGNLDSTGHQEGSGLAHRIPELIASLVYRVESLLAAGWREVRIVTDHGWLLLPGGLPKTDLPKYLTATRWRRCAVVKESAIVDAAVLLVVLGREGADRLSAGNRLLHGRRRVQPRRPQLAGMLGSATFGPRGCATGRYGEHREREVGRAAMPGQGEWAVRRMQSGPAGQGGRSDHFAVV